MMLRDLLICLGVVVGSFVGVAFIVLRALKMKEYYDKLLSVEKKTDDDENTD